MSGSARVARISSAGLRSGAASLPIIPGNPAAGGRFGMFDSTVLHELRGPSRPALRFAAVMTALAFVSGACSSQARLDAPTVVADGEHLVGAFASRRQGPCRVQGDPLRRASRRRPALETADAAHAPAGRAAGHGVRAVLPPGRRELGLLPPHRRDVRPGPEPGAEPRSHQRELPLPQRLDSEPRRQEPPPGDVLDSRRRQRQRHSQRPCRPTARTSPARASWSCPSTTASTCGASSPTRR